MRKLKRLLAREDGIALATVVMLTAMLTLLSVVLIDQVTAESNRAGDSLTANSVYQAAEAGINDYLAKLVDDPQFYDHYVAKGESTRLSATGTTVAHSTSTVNNTWDSGTKWTYPNGKDWWYAGGSSTYGNSTALRGYAYNLMITPPSVALGTNYVDIVSTGCRVVDQNASPLVCDSRFRERAVEIRVRRSTPADFQFMADYDPTKYSPVCYGSTLYGKIYSTHDICFNSSGESYSDLMAEGYVTGISGSRLHSPARIYDTSHPDIGTVIKNHPITFASLGDPSLDIKRAAALNAATAYGTTDFEDPAAAAWRINFSSNGNFQAWKCISSGAADPASSQPFCGSDLALSSAVSAGAKTITVSGSPYEFQPTGTIYIGTGTGQEGWTYSSRTTSAPFTFSCTGGGCGLSKAHAAGERVSYTTTGISWAVPYYNGPVPSNGAIYTGQDTIISWPTAITGFTETSQDGSPTSKVNGRVTVATAGDMIIAGDVHYASESPQDGIGGDDDDVLGLIAKGNVWLAKYAPMNLWWRAATMAVTGIWSDYNCTNRGPYRGDTSTMTFVGTSAYTNPTGCMQYGSGWGSSGYNIDGVSRISDDGSAGQAVAAYAQYDALKFLFPPWFPVINGMETTVLFREVPATYTPPVVS